MTEYFLPIIIGAAAGCLAGCGVGGGTLLLLYLTAFSSVSAGEAKWINLLFFTVTAAVSLVSHVKNKLIVWRATLVCTLSGAIFAGLSSYITSKLSENALKTPFALLFIIVGIKELLAKKHQKDAYLENVVE